MLQTSLEMVLSPSLSLLFFLLLLLILPLPTKGKSSSASLPFKSCSKRWCCCRCSAACPLLLSLIFLACSDNFNSSIHPNLQEIRINYHCPHSFAYFHTNFLVFSRFINFFLLFCTIFRVCAITNQASSSSSLLLFRSLLTMADIIANFFHMRIFAKLSTLAILEIVFCNIHCYCEIPRG